jgi:predicted dehydrogenase
MCHLFGDPVQAWGIVETLKVAIESEDACAAWATFEGGAICSCQATMSAHRSTAGFDIVGSEASVHAPGAFECLDRGHRDEIRRSALAAVPDDPSDSRSSAHTPYIAAVLDALEADRPLPIGPAEARRSLELATAIYASSLTASPVALPIDAGNRFYEGITRGDYEARPRLGRKVTVGG